MKIGRVEVVAVTTKAQDVDLGYRSFIIQNTSEDAVVYIKEKHQDKADVTTETGFSIWPGETLNNVLSGKTLSIIGSAAAKVRIMYLD